MSLRGRVGKKCRAKDEEPKTDLYLDLLSHLSLLSDFVPISVHQRLSVVPVPRLLAPHRGTTLRRRDSPCVVILTASQIRRGGPTNFCPFTSSASPREVL